MILLGVLSLGRGLRMIVVAAIRIVVMLLACIFGALATVCFAVDGYLAGDIKVERIKTGPTHA